MIRFSRLALVLIAAGAIVATSACGFKRKKYENPITKDTQQPDKILFDKSIRDIEKGRYELARLTLNTLINTYDTSEYLAKAKLAIADSWYREGGTHGMAQAEAEYKDFILFYPAMEEAAESQSRICDIHIDLMEKSDRDPNNALRAEYECKQLMTQFPNSAHARAAEQKLRNVQEALAQAEMAVGDFYHHKGANSAAANRLAWGWRVHWFVAGNNSLVPARRCRRAAKLAAISRRGARVGWFRCPREDWRGFRPRANRFSGRSAARFRECIFDRRG